MKNKTIMMSMYLTSAQKKALDQLVKNSHIPRAVLVREAIDDLLKKYKRKTSGPAVSSRPRTSV